VNVQEYISSGIVESYVLGLASAEERTEFENMCLRHPEVLQARTDFELALENQAMEGAVAPPSALKQAIFNELKTEGKLVTMQEPVPVKSMSWLKYAAAACVILLAGSIYLNIILSNSNVRLSGKNKIVENKYEKTLAELSDIKKDIQVLLSNQNVKMAAMGGLEVSPKSFATVYWDTTSHDVWLLTNNLPAPPSDKQYQLWALMDGQPIDLGVIDNEHFIKQDRLLLKAKNTQNAQAFAITLEKKGGNPTPEGKMIVLGNL
jgi:anti-sigma-K factor RskA